MNSAQPVHNDEQSGIFSNLSFDAVVEFLAAKNMKGVARRFGWDPKRIVMIDSVEGSMMEFTGSCLKQLFCTNGTDSTATDWQLEITP